MTRPDDLVPLHVVKLASFSDGGEPPKSWPVKRRAAYMDGRWIAGRVLDRLDGVRVPPDALHAGTLMKPRAEREAEPPAALGAVLGSILEFQSFRTIRGLADPDTHGHICLIALKKAGFEILGLATDLPDKRLIALRRARAGQLLGALRRLVREPALLRSILAQGRA